MKLYDTHSHLYDRKFEDDLQEVMRRAVDAGVRDVLVPVENYSTFLKAKRELAGFSSPRVHLAIGYHPLNYREFPGEEEFKEMVKDHLEDVVAIGEVGLDFHWLKDGGERTASLDVFVAQLRVAVDFDLPVVVHIRECFREVLAVLRGFGGRVKGVAHSFTGGPKEAEELVNLGFYVSFSGILTFPKAKKVKEAAIAVPKDRLCVETDAPYLAPQPYRGRRNEPAYVVEVVKELAKIKKRDAEELAEVVYNNSVRLFNRGREK